MFFNNKHITFNESIRVGDDDAPIKIVEYINLRCPDSKNYELNIVPYLDSYIEEGKIQRIIKHFDKESNELEKGNLMNQYIDYKNDTKSSKMIHQLFQEQNNWAQHRISQIPHIASNYGLKLEKANQMISSKVMKEIQKVGVKRIPTIFINKKAFIEDISLQEVQKEIKYNLG